MNFPCYWFDAQRAFFLGNCGLVNNTGQQQHKHKGEVSFLLGVNGSPADTIFHPFFPMSNLTVLLKSMHFYWRGGSFIST